MGFKVAQSWRIASQYNWIVRAYYTKPLTIDSERTTLTRQASDRFGPSNSTALGHSLPSFEEHCRGVPPYVSSTPGFQVLAPIVIAVLDLELVQDSGYPLRCSSRFQSWLGLSCSMLVSKHQEGPKII